MAKGTNFKYGLRNRGVPVTNGGNPYLGMWGEDIWFVDYADGNDGNSGSQPSAARQNLQSVLDDADFGANDVIYIRAYTTAASRESNDPAYILPESTTNWDIAAEKYGVALIGTGYGSAQGGQLHTVLRASATAAATPTLRIAAPLTLCENLGFHDGASTAGQGGGGVDVGLDGNKSVSGVTGFTAQNGYAMGNTLSNCMFRFGSRDSVTICSVHYASILDCVFQKGAGINIFSDQQVPDFIEIGYNRWAAVASQVSVNIKAYGQTDGIMIHDNIFPHVLPTGGENMYIILTNSTGHVCNNFFGLADAGSSTAIASVMTFSAGVVTQSGNYTSDGLVT